MKKLIFSLLSFTTTFISQAQAPNEKSLLWAITGKGLSQPSYLYGTFHLLCPVDFSMPDTVAAAFHNTKQLYLEIDMSDPSLTEKMMQGIAMKDGHKLQDFITPKEYDSLSVAFKRITNLPLQFVSTYKPFMIMSLLYPSMLGCTPVAFEGEFQKMAEKDLMKIKGLETVEDQLKVFDDIPYQVQAKMLLSNVNDFDKSKSELSRMVNMYHEKDITVMQSSIEEDKDFAKYENELLDKRNKNWIPVIQKAIAEKPSFIAVGAGHLGGEKGVISLLRQAGYTVKPVKY